MQPRFYAFDMNGVVVKRLHPFVSEAASLVEPNPPVVEAIRRLKAQGHVIILFSTIGANLVRRFCDAHDIPYDYVNENPRYPNTNPGKPVATVYVDDRAVCYRGQSADELVEELNAFTPYRPDVA